LSNRMGEQNFIEATQATLGKVIQKPSLSEKNLSRPPFRFLHDIVAQLIKKTGFFKGLFPDELLVSENVKDKEQKVKFLQAIIACTSLINGAELDVRATAIVAGKEADKTNLLLATIGRLILDKRSSDEAVEVMKNGATAKSEKPKEKKREKKQEVDQSKERKSSRKEREASSSRRRPSVEESGKKKNTKTRDEIRENERKEKDASKERSSSKKPKETPEEREKRKEAEREDRRRRRQDEKKIAKSGRPPRPTSAKGERTSKPAPVIEPEPEQPKKQLRERPTSARPAKRVERRGREPAEEATPGAGAAGTTAEPAVNPNLIIDNNDDDEDDNVPTFEEELENDKPLKNVEVDENAEHGALVKDLIESKKAIESTKSNKKSVVVSEAEQERAKKQIEMIQAEIQQITRTTQPIGRVLDFIQEDMESMKKEFEMWSDELVRNQAQINKGSEQNDASLQHLYDELDALAAQTSSKRNDINATKAKIHANKSMIEKQVKMMLST